jgi:hypothetical protein
MKITIPLFAPKSAFHLNLNQRSKNSDRFALNNLRRSIRTISLQNSKANPQMTSRMKFIILEYLLFMEILVGPVQLLFSYRFYSLY